MSVLKKIKDRTERRKNRVSGRIRRETLLPRVSVFRSLNHMYAQLIDDATGMTIASSSTLEFKGLVGDKKTVAQAIGKELAQRAQEKGVKKAAFDRGSFLYHGRVAAVAQGLRDGGLEI